MEQLVILVIIGLISLVNWLIQRSAEARERRRLERKREGSSEGDPFHSGGGRESEPPPPVPDADPAREMRRLMEAFGIPMETEEPAPQEKIRPSAPPAFPEFLQPPAWVPPASRQKIVRAEAVPSIAPPAGRRGSAAPISSLLRTRNAARQAIVLREVLGPPKAFQ